ncbi:hypothetical protein NP493_1324g01064 [Ridgeia piscesae]|uniref:Cytokine-inducible SH2-containing protein n=1 Tax=Ridgeia piscesae TaxID=27915 RepID=A0AAD9NGL1_RIDPI|nr:hypothetical protein NP493_1324g01064 [Ridgeia piscesae]
MCVEGNMDRYHIGSGGDGSGREPLPDLLLGTTTTPAEADQRTYENCTRCHWTSTDHTAVLAGKCCSTPVASAGQPNIVRLPLPLPIPTLPKIKVPQLAGDCIPPKTCVTTATATPCVATDAATVTSTRTAPRPLHPVHTAPATGCNQRQTARQSVTPSQHISGYAKASVFRTEDDMYIIEATETSLKTCGFYYGKLSVVDAKRKLRRATFGTYLLRDSSDPNFLYSLSVKTKRGTTSVRISYSRGQFRLDCDEALVDAVPSFDCVLKLVEHYTLDESRGDTGRACVFLESSGRRDTPIDLVRPYIETVPSLKAACRKVVNRNVPPNTEQRRELPVSDDVRCFLAEYPFTM